MIKRVGLILAVIALAAGLFWSLRSHPGLLDDVHLVPVAVLTLVVTPLILLLNALEFFVIARLIGSPLDLKRCFAVTVIGSAANLLPLPGAAAVRITALKRAGATMASSISVSVLTVAISVGMAFLYCGFWATTFGFGPIALWLPGVGLAILTGSFFVTRQAFNSGGFVALCLVRLVLVIADAFRILAAFEGLGIAVRFGQASVLAVSTTLASLVTIVPGGLGVREWLAALAAPLIGLQAPETFVAATLSQVAGLVVLMLSAALIAWRARNVQPS